MEFRGILEDKIPLNAFPAKIQDMVLALARQENYSIEYMMASSSMEHSESHIYAITCNPF